MSLGSFCVSKYSVVIHCSTVVLFWWQYWC